MTVPGNLSSPLLATAAAAAAVEGPIKSLRFNSGDSAYLNFTPSSNGNRKTWTWSAWIKIGKLSNWGSLFKAGDSDANPTTQLYLYSDNTLEYITYDAATKGRLLLSQIFRDPSAWYHIVLAIDTTDATADNRQRIYINGTEVTDFGSRTNHAQNYETFVNSSSYAHEIGRTTNIGGSSQKFFDGYMADIHFIDGSALDPTSFGAYNSSGVWQAAAYSGTYGTNGFHLLDFANESTVGHDSSGNENDFTANNISTSAGAGNDVLFDVPTNGTQSDTGTGGEVSGNYATLNPLQKSSGSTLTNGNLDISMTSAQGTTFATMAFPASGKWYFECTANNTQCDVGIAKADADLSQYLGKNSSGYGYYVDGNVYNNDASVGSGATYTTGDVIGVAFDADAGTVKWYKNNSLQVTVSSLSGEWFPAFGSGNAAGIFNFGSRPFAYSAPSNHKALCTTNLPTATVADGSAYFQTALWDGTGSARSITTTGMSPDWVWIKERGVAGGHNLYDAVRGATKFLASEDSNAEGTDSSALTSFNSDGFSLGTGFTVKSSNKSGRTYAGWCWDGGSSTVTNTDGTGTCQLRANPTAGFSIATFTGVGTAKSYGHGLNAVPEMVIVKGINHSDGWSVYHSALGNTKSLALQSTSAAGTSTVWDNTSPTSTVTRIGGDYRNTGNTNLILSFAPVAGFSKMGSYEGNGSNDGVFIHTGHRVGWVLIKSTTESTRNWVIFDTARDALNTNEARLSPNTNGAELTQGSIDFLSNGFKLRNGTNPGAEEMNKSGQTYIYYAIAENSFQANGGLAR